MSPANGAETKRKRLSNTVRALAAIAIIGFFVPYFIPRFHVVWRWLLMVAVIVWYLRDMGKEVHGRSAGVLIDTRYKISLSRFQLILWTLVVFPAFLTIALDRCIPVARQELQIIKFDAEKSAQPEGIDPLYIVFPETLLVALGISTASLAGASIIKESKQDPSSRKVALLKQRLASLEDEIESIDGKIAAEVDSLAETQPELVKADAEREKWRESDNATAKAIAEAAYQQITGKQREIGATIADLGQKKKAVEEELRNLRESVTQSRGSEHTNQSADQAQWYDMVRQEEADNPTVIDIGKVQMLLVTFAVVFAYAILLFAQMRGDLRAATFDLPEFSASMNTWLGMSHAGYLTTKQTGG